MWGITVGVDLGLSRSPSGIRRRVAHGRLPMETSNVTPSNAIATARVPNQTLPPLVHISLGSWRRRSSVRGCCIAETHERRRGAKFLLVQTSLPA